MHLLSTMLLFWIGVSAASLIAAALVIAVEVCAASADSAAGSGPHLLLRLKE